MAFVPKEWKDRLVEFAGRRKLTNVSTGEEMIVDVVRNEGAVSQEGDAFSGANMSDLEQRVADEFNNINADLTAQYSTIKRKTGRKWIDGKDIYELVIKKQLGTVSSGTVIDNSINYSNIDSLIKFDVTLKNSSASNFRMCPITPVSAYGAYVYITNNGIVANGSSNALGDISNTTFSCVIEYTEN